jgi:pyrimidine-nucleoside phosphorylase
MSGERNVVALIDRKKRGGELTAEEIRFLLEGFVAKRIPDYQLSAWLMAVVWRGMTEAETLALTRAMVESGVELDWSGLDRPTVDKHSTGGVGDKTSLVLVPLMAAAGAAFVKMSGRGLGHTGGTLDKLEAIPGFRVSLELEAMRAQVERIGCALVGQSPELVPADRDLYALRDVTGTVESIPLIAGSIMSKKLAGGARTVVLDVKWGAGAFMTTLEEARELASALVRIGEGAGRRTRAVLSPMEEPLGRAVGMHLLLLSGLETGEDRARARLRELRDTGRAAEVFAELVEAQGGDRRVVDDPDGVLPRAPTVREVVQEAEGDRWVAALDARGVGVAALDLGAGRRRKGDPVDPAVGIVLRARIGDRVPAGAPLAEVHARTEEGWREAAERLRALYRLSAEPVERPAARFETVG